MKRLLAVTLLAACGASPSEGGLGTPDNPLPQPAEKGPYQVQSTIDLTVEAILPAQGELVVATLRDFSTNPAHALLTIADKTGVPIASTLLAVLPQVLLDALEGWINDEIAKIQIAGHPVTDYTAQVVALIDTALTQFALDSELAITDGSASHRMTGIDFSPAGIDVKLPIGGLAGDVLTQMPAITIAEAGAMTVGDQHFGLAYGEYAWQGVNAASTALFGSDVRSTLGKAIDCPGLAHAIAARCVLAVCVGHEPELTQLCTAGLDAAVGAVHDQLSAMQFEVLHFAQGTARLVDDDGDGVADRIVDGTWDAELDLGMGLRHTPATFAATR